jgi:hypothetical protein
MKHFKDIYKFKYLGCSNDFFNFCDKSSVISNDDLFGVSNWVIFDELVFLIGFREFGFREWYL